MGFATTIRKEAASEAAKAQEEEAARKAQEDEEAARKTQEEEEAASKAREEEVTRKAQEEEAARKAQEDEEAARKVQEEEEASQPEQHRFEEVLSVPHLATIDIDVPQPRTSRPKLNLPPGHRFAYGDDDRQWVYEVCAVDDT